MTAVIDLSLFFLHSQKKITSLLIGYDYFGEADIFSVLTDLGHSELE